MGMTIIIALVTFVVGGLLVWFVMRVLMKSRYDAVIRAVSYTHLTLPTTSRV